MFSWFDAALARRIDALTWNHGKRSGREGELKQLSNLFGDRYLRALHRAMTAKLIGAQGPAAVLTIKLAWIDKIPVAASTALIHRTELGDAVLFAIEETKARHGAQPGPMRARAVILQAKVTRDERQIRSPSIPVAPMTGSTAREYTLLSQWPRFDLYKTARSGSALAKGLHLQSGQVPPPFGWYLAAARGDRLTASIRYIWRSWWMLGPPDQGQGCNVSFGSFLRGLLAGRQLQTTCGALEAGAAFQCASYPPPRSVGSDWDQICAEIINIVENSDAPPSLFGAGIGRMATVREIPLHFVCSSAAPPRLAYAEGLPGTGQPRWLYSTNWKHALYWWPGPLQSKRLQLGIPRPQLAGHGGRLTPWHTGPRRRGRRIPVLIFHALVPEGDG